MGEHVYSRVDSYLRALKYLNDGINKKEWMAKALDKKLEKEKDTGLLGIPGAKQIYFQLDQDAAMKRF